MKPGFGVFSFYQSERTEKIGLQKKTQIKNDIRGVIRQRETEQQRTVLVLKSKSDVANVSSDAVWCRN